MAKRSIKARDLVNDKRAGLDDTALMEKYRIPTLSTLHRFLRQLVEAGLLNQSEIGQVKCLNGAALAKATDGVHINSLLSGVQTQKDLNASALVKWRFNTGCAIDSSPAVSDGVVCIWNNAGDFYALDVRTGREKWRLKAELYGQSSPTIAKGIVYFCAGRWSSPGYCWAADLQSGKLIWQFPIKLVSCQSSPAVIDDVVYIGNSKSERLFESYALDARTGRVLWRLTLNSRRQSYLILDSSHSLSEGVSCFIAHDGILYAADATTGKDLWKMKGNSIDPIPVSKGLVYRMIHANDSLFLCAIDMRTGLERSRFKIRNAYHPRSILSNGTLYVGGDKNNLYSLDIDSQQEKWSFQSSDSIGGLPSVNDKTVCFGSYDGHIYAVDVVTGEGEWRFKTGGLVRCTPAVSDGVVYCASNDGYLYAITST